MSEPIGPLGLRVGQQARRTQTVTARDVALYAEITGDRNPLLRATTISNQDGTVVLDGECWTYTLRPA
jgi:hypothetical protein